MRETGVVVLIVWEEKGEGKRVGRWIRTDVEDGAVGRDGQRVECDIGRGAFESELGLKVAGVGGGGRVEFGGEEEEEGGDGEGFHFRCWID